MKIKNVDNMTCDCSARKKTSNNVSQRVVTKRVPVTTQRTATSGRRIIRRSAK